LLRQIHDCRQSLLLTAWQRPSVAVQAPQSRQLPEARQSSLLVARQSPASPAQAPWYVQARVPRHPRGEGDSATVAFVVAAAAALAWGLALVAAPASAGAVSWPHETAAHSEVSKEAARLGRR